jgi:putative NADPH-quinone reductase
MNILVILGHQDPNSFNHAIASTVCETSRDNGHRVLFHDLYAEEFDPLLTKAEISEHGLVPESIQRHCEELRSSSDSNPPFDLAYHVELAWLCHEIGLE